MEFTERDMRRSAQAYDDEVPDGVLMLTACVDMQANRLEYLFW